MTELNQKIHDDSNSLDYTLVGDYYIPNLQITEEHRSIGIWGHRHREYLQTEKPLLFTELCLSGKLYTYLADLNKQACERLSVIIRQMQEAEGVTKALKKQDQMEWVRRMNSIRSRAEEIILHEMICV